MTLSTLTAAAISIEPLSDSVASMLLFKHLEAAQPGGADASRHNHSDKELHNKAELVVKELSGIPLAISFVVGIFFHLNLDEILHALQDTNTTSRIFNVEFPPASLQYERTLGNVWDIAQRRLSQDALRLVQILAMLSPTGVPEHLIFSKHKDKSLLFLSAQTSAM